MERGLGLFKLLLGTPVFAAQHEGEALVVEDFRRRANDADGLLVGAVGEIEAVQVVIAGRQADPGGGGARMLADGAAEALRPTARAPRSAMLMVDRIKCPGIGVVGKLNGQSALLPPNTSTSAVT